MDELKDCLSLICKKLFNYDGKIEVTIPEEQFGDFTTNIAMKLGKLNQQNPADVANKIIEEIQKLNSYEKVELAGPGFINVTLKDEDLISILNSKFVNEQKNKQILVEFGDPNPMKVMHLGHLYTTIVGDSIARLYEAAGANVKRLCYQGDVGLHVAKAIWGIGEKIAWDTSKLEKENPFPDISSNLGLIIGLLYSNGAQAYEENEKIKTEIQEINKKVYEKADDTINTIYEWGTKVSYKYFESVFELLNVKYDHKYFESESMQTGLEAVNENIDKVFSRSDGAIIYKGENDGLHTRVFINSQGLPTYEAKDLGLVELKDKDYPNAETSIVITANEQVDYFKVMLAALSKFNPSLAQKTKHITHGFISLTTGKMSSRTGDVYQAQTLIDQTYDEIKKMFPNSKVIHEVHIAALKYTFLKQRIGNNITFDVHESVSLEGNSGPYLQYAYVRAKSILSKSKIKDDHSINNLTEAERTLVRKMCEFQVVLTSAIQELMPHQICTYIYELAQIFNSFYEKNRIIDDEREGARIEILKKYTQILKQCFEILNIPVIEKM